MSRKPSGWQQNAQYFKIVREATRPYKGTEDDNRAAAARRRVEHLRDTQRDVDALKEVWE